MKRNELRNDLFLTNINWSEQESIFQYMGSWGNLVFIFRGKIFLNIQMYICFVFIFIVPVIENPSDNEYVRMTGMGNEIREMKVYFFFFLLFLDEER